MKTLHVATVGVVVALAALFLARKSIGDALARSAFERSVPEPGSSDKLLQSLSSGTGDREQRPQAPPQSLPADATRPSTEQELETYVAWLRSLGHEELLRLSNAEFDFEESALIRVLSELEGPWVAKALGGLAIAEANPLVKAILVEGLSGRLSDGQLDDATLIPVLDQLIGHVSLAQQDPYGVADGLAMLAYCACAKGHGNYAQLMGMHLASSDNSDLLVQGYLFMGSLPGGQETLIQMLTGHASEAGRFGALEGLRNLGANGQVPPAQITALGLQALEVETNARNRLLLYEMMISTGGEEALSAVEQAWRAGEVSGIDETAVMLAMKMDPARAQALFLDTLRDGELTSEARQAIYNAMGAMQGDEGAQFLLEQVRNEELDGAERLAGLRGLWNREVDERLAGELQSVLESSEDPALRSEALRMLAYGETEGRGVDLRQVAMLDDDPGIRAEAVQLAAMQPASGTRAWLEERLLEDDSLDVKTAALGALVYQAHYTGDGEDVLGYLSRARKFTDDEQTLALIAQGEQMVKDYDPRNLELGLAKDAEFYDTLARLTDGPSARAFQRQAKQLSGIVAALRGSQDGRRSAQR